jgi:hypothetical protein
MARASARAFFLVENRYFNSSHSPESSIAYRKMYAVDSYPKLSLSLHENYREFTFQSCRIEAIFNRTGFPKSPWIRELPAFFCRSGIGNAKAFEVLELRRSKQVSHRQESPIEA